MTPELAALRARIPEAALVTACLGFLRARGWPALRINAGTALRRNGKDGAVRPVQLAPEGWPDLMAVLPDGRACLVEAKRPGRYMTPAQANMLARLRRQGALALLIYDVAELERELRAHGYVK